MSTVLGPEVVFRVVYSTLFSSSLLLLITDHGDWAFNLFVAWAVSILLHVLVLALELVLNRDMIPDPNPPFGATERLLDRVPLPIYYFGLILAAFTLDSFRGQRRSLGLAFRSRATANTRSRLGALSRGLHWTRGAPTTTIHLCLARNDISSTDRHIFDRGDRGVGPGPRQDRSMLSACSGK